MAPISKPTVNIFPSDIEAVAEDEIALGGTETSAPNRLIKPLSDRTLYLKEQIEALQESLGNVREALYPVGSVYTNRLSATNPATLLGFGTWVRIQGRVVVGLLGGDTNFGALGQEGGAVSVGLTEANNGPHGHSVSQTPHAHGYTRAIEQTNSGGIGFQGGNNDGGYQSLATATANANIGINVSGSGTPHYNLQPYIVCYVWYRQA